MGRARGGSYIDWLEKFDRVSSSPERDDGFYAGSAPAGQGAAAAKGGDEPRRRFSSRRHHPDSDGLPSRRGRLVFKIKRKKISGTGSPSPDRADAIYPGSAPAAQAGGGEGGRQAAAGSFDPPPPPPLPSRVEGLSSLSERRRLRAVPEAASRRPSIDAVAKEDEHDEGESNNVSSAKKSRKLIFTLRACLHYKPDTEKEDAVLDMLGEINKSLQASSKSPEPLQVPKDASPEEIFEALKGIPRLARADLLRAYSMLTQDDRRFRSLMALPKNMRKEWLLMEIGSI